MSYKQNPIFSASEMRDIMLGAGMGRPQVGRLLKRLRKADAWCTLWAQREYEAYLARLQASRRARPPRLHHSVRVWCTNYVRHGYEIIDGNLGPVTRGALVAAILLGLRSMPDLEGRSHKYTLADLRPGRTAARIERLVAAYRAQVPGWIAGIAPEVAS